MKLLQTKSEHLDKVYAEAGQWLRMVNTLGWAMASFSIPLSFSAIGFAIRYPGSKWVFGIGSISLFAFWLLVSFMYRRTTMDARKVLTYIENKRWNIDAEASFCVKQQPYMGGRWSGVAPLQAASLGLLIALWIWILFF